MAQQKRGIHTKLGRLACRYGLKTAGHIVVVCIAFIVLIACVVAGTRLASAGWGKGITIERSSEATRIQSQDEVDPDVENQASGSGQLSTIYQHSNKNSENSQLVIDVDGAVVLPGVYTISGSSPRVTDAVAAAGGLTNDADTSRINLAAPLSDGEKIYIPYQGEQDIPQLSSGTTDTTSSSSTSSSLSSSASSNTKININTASSQELQTLPGVGEVIAAAIIEERETNGPFESIEGLTNVSGIGEKKYEKLKDLICV